MKNAVRQAISTPWRVILLAGSLLALPGCGDRGMPPHQLAQPTILKPGALDTHPKIEVPICVFSLPTEPIKVNQKINLQLGLEVAKDSKVPEGVVVQLVQGETEITSVSATVSETPKVAMSRNEKSFTLDAKLTTPKEPGRYTLRAEYVYNTFTKGVPKPTTSYLHSPGLEIEVLP